MKLYSLTDVSKMLSVSRQWLWVLIASKRIIAIKVGKFYVITETALLEYLSAKNQNKPDTEQTPGEQSIHESDNRL